MGGTAAIIAENAQLRAARHKHPVSVVTLDVDHFKAFDDNHGHDAGDTVLRHVGEILQSLFTDDAVPCRFGGEEFVVQPRRTLDWRRNRCGMRQGGRPGRGGARRGAGGCRCAHRDGWQAKKQGSVRICT